MAHECPECGQVCYCCGDIDDICMNTDEMYVKCEHYKQCQPDEEKSDEEYLDEYSKDKITEE